MSVRYQATGRRKRAVAQVVLKPGTGKVTVNGRDVKEYFCERGLWMERITEPLTRCSLADKFDIDAKLHGGGVNGQADALRLGIARALVDFNEPNRKILKPLRMLTRDPREVERKHYGKHGARKSHQYSKR